MTENNDGEKIAEILQSEIDSFMSRKNIKDVDGKKVHAGMPMSVLYNLLKKVGTDDEIHALFDKLSSMVGKKNKNIY